MIPVVRRQLSQLVTQKYRECQLSISSLVPLVPEFPQLWIDTLHKRQYNRLNLGHSPSAYVRTRREIFFHLETEHHHSPLATNCRFPRLLYPPSESNTWDR